MSVLNIIYFTLLLQVYTAGRTSENGSSMKIDCESSEFSDRGYGTQVENQESMSTSSNEDEEPFTLVHNL